MDTKQKNKLFIATFLDDTDKNFETFINKLSFVSENYLRIVPAEKFHVTWKFIGEIDSNENEKVFNIVKEYSHIIRNCSLNFDKLEIWPNAKYPRLAALTSRNYDEKITNYFNNIEESLYKDLKIKKEKGKFIPHITLARTKPNKNIDILKDLVIEPMKLNINQTSVVQSINGLDGTLYKFLYKQIL